MVGEQYEAMLQSALDDQAQHYQGEISRLEAELAAETVNVANLSPPELKRIEELERNIAKMRAEVEKMSRYLVEAQAEEASHRTKANVLLREQSVASKLLEKLRQEFELEQEQGEQQMEELKQQISDISANIRLQERIAKNGNLKEAHILGTSDVLVREQSKKRSSRKNKR
jgi:translation initiation factor 2B subunit (eIF-2B alpha/beta/delta family)